MLREVTQPLDLLGRTGKSLRGAGTEQCVPSIIQVVLIELFLKSCFLKELGVLELRSQL